MVIRMAYIYKITNKINNKIYIGETTQTIKKRWNQHVSDSLNKTRGYNYHIHNAMRKYGIGNFSIEIIEQCSNEARFAREHYYIMYYNSLEPNGYNFLASSTGSVKVPIEAILESWQDKLSAKEIAEKLGIHKQTVTEHLKANGITQTEIMQRQGRSTSLRCSMPVLQYSLDGTFIKEWPSATSCTAIGSQTAISSVCRQEQFSAYGYLWKYKNDERPIEMWVERLTTKKPSGRPKKPIIQLDESHAIINIYESAAAAAKALNKKDKSNICAAARNHKKAYGYYWEYKLD